MDSELQKALDIVELIDSTQPVFKNYEVWIVKRPVIDAARKVANPDIEAAAEVLDPYMVHPLEVMEATKAVVAAALGITEDTPHDACGCMKCHPEQNTAGITEDTDD